MRLCYLGAIVALYSAAACAELQLPDRWIHGADNEPALQVHEAATGLWVIRQSKRSHFEAPFMYLIAGNERALLLDTGAKPDLGSVLPLRSTMDPILDIWRQEHPRFSATIIAHTHGHADHTAGDDQFQRRPDTIVVGASAEAVAEFFGFDRERKEVHVDLGGRRLTVLQIPGHEPAHIALYDEATGALFTGDTLYPGVLTVRDLAAYRGSIAHLAEFVRRNRVEQVLGAHIEMTREPAVIYPLGTRYQPDEHALALGARHVAELAHAVAALGDFRHDDVHDDFVVRRVPSASQDRASIHGMVLFGRDVTYLSHLPLLHPPHDYQLIAEAKMDADALASYRADSARHPDQLYTIAPNDAWILGDMMRAGRRFTADLYRGHFERSGEVIAKRVGLTITRIVHFRRFEPGTKLDPSRWIAVGRGRQRFLVHRIETAGDFDRIVEVDGVRRLPEGSDVRLSINGDPAAGHTIGPRSALKTIYMERDDLAR